jgi:phosphatidylserine/phosphatidylglycerophosphate/cardiolipin synthase-like enzyme
MKFLAILLFPILAFPLEIISSEFGGLIGAILKSLSESETASVVALSVSDPDFLSELSKKKYWILSEYPSNLRGKVDTAPGLMHAKFIVLNETVVFGSMNFTTSSLREDLNDGIIFTEKCARDFFSNLMNSLWKGEIPKTPWDCEFGSFHVSPYEDLEKYYMETLDKAKKCVCIAVYAFTDMNIFGALKYLSSKGIEVRIALDDWNKEWVLKENAEQFKLKVFEDPTLHHKFVIVDDNTLITGSANLTESAFRKNVEVIFITHRKDIIREYREMFEILWRW